MDGELKKYGILRSPDGSIITAVEVDTPQGRKSLSAMRKAGWTVHGDMEIDLTIGAFRMGFAYNRKGGRK